MNELQNILEKLPEPKNLPRALPLLHLSLGEWFDNILYTGRLIPQDCQVFQQKLLYFSYGAVNYFPPNQNSEKAAKLPIAFLFNTSLLKEVKVYSPFDTGAAVSKKYGSWSEKLANFKKYLIEGQQNSRIPRILVYYIYENNRKYINGEVTESCYKQPAPFPEIYEFLKEDLSGEGTDNRQCTIECQIDHDVILAKHLLWIGIPETYMDKVSALYKKYLESENSNITIDDYRYPKNFNPDRLAYLLRDKAIKYMESSFLKFD